MKVGLTLKMQRKWCHLYWTQNILKLLKTYFHYAANVAFSTGQRVSYTKRALYNRTNLAITLMEVVDSIHPAQRDIDQPCRACQFAEYQYEILTGSNNTTLTLTRSWISDALKNQSSLISSSLTISCNIDPWMNSFSNQLSIQVHDTLSYAWIYLLYTLTPNYR